MKPEELSLEEQVERIRRKREQRYDITKVRPLLNTIFLILAAIGLVMYFLGGEKQGSTNVNHVPGLVVIGVGMLFKVAEFILRIF